MIELTLWPSLTEPKGKLVALTWQALTRALAAPKPAPADPERPNLPGWSPATFREDRRAKDAVVAVTALVLDVDKGNVPIEKLRLVLGNLQATVHSTRRSTPSAPRWRVVVRCTRSMDPDEHAIVWRRMAGLLSGSGVVLDEATKDPSRFWFMPCEPAEGEYFIESIEGSPLDVDALLEAAKRVEQREPVTETRVREPVAVPAEPDELARISSATRRRRACAYLLHAEPSIAGSQGHNVAMRVVTAVVRGFALSESDARDALTSWNARCEPPWSDRELAHKISEASRVGALPWGKMLLESTEPKKEESKSIDVAAWNLLGVRELAEPLPPIPWLVEPIRLAPGAVSLVAGYGYSRKTMALQSLSLSVAAGRSVWGLYSCRKGRVVHLDYEQGKRLTRERYQRLARGMGVELADLEEDALRVACMPRVYLESHESVESLRPVVDGAALVVIDSLRAAFPHADENASDVRSYLDALTHLSEDTGATVVLIHHARKPNVANGGTATHAIRGSSALFDACQSVYVFEGEKDTPTTVHHQKDRVLGTTAPDFGLTSEDVQGPAGARWGLRVRHLEAEQVEDAAESRASIKQNAAVERAAQRILHAVLDAGGAFAGSRSTIRALVGGNHDAFDRAWALLVRDGTLVRDGSARDPNWRISS